MSTRKRAAVGCLGLLALALVGFALVVINRDRVVAALESQSERVRATRFRLGEVMSISTGGLALSRRWSMRCSIWPMRS